MKRIQADSLRRWPTARPFFEPPNTPKTPKPGLADSAHRPTEYEHKRREAAGVTGVLTAVVAVSFGVFGG